MLNPSATLGRELPHPSAHRTHGVRNIGDIRLWIEVYEHAQHAIPIGAQRFGGHQDAPFTGVIDIAVREPQRVIPRFLSADLKVVGWRILRQFYFDELDIVRVPVTIAALVRHRLPAV
jgi:hypothetical protein